MRPSSDRSSSAALDPALLERMLDQVPTPMWLAALDGRLLWMNRAWLDFSGTTLDEGRSLPWTHWVHPDDLTHAAAACLGAIERREPFEALARVRRHDGQWRWVANSGVPSTDEHGHVVAYAGCCSDVTERRLASARLHLVLDHVGGAAFLHTPEGRYLYVNREWHALFNPSGMEVVGRHLSDFFPPSTESEIRRSSATTMALGGKLQYELVLPTVNGPRLFLVNKFPLTDPIGDVEAICGVATDVTELRDREARTREIERRLVDAHHLESLAVLAGGIAHDFNNLLQSMLGHASLLASELPEDSPSRLHVAPIEEAASRAAGLTRQMLDYAGLSLYEREPIAVGSLLERWERSFRALVPRSTVLRVQVATGLPGLVGDEGRLAQVLTHLATNALEALADRAGRIDVRAYERDVALPPPTVPAGLPALPTGRYVVIEMEDDGDGMDTRVIERLWDPFFSTRFPGRGLGLPAALGIARAHGGTIEVESAPGAGSTFRLVLPAAHPSRSDSRNAAP